MTRHFISSLLALMLFLTGPSMGAAQEDLGFFRIATGNLDGIYASIAGPFVQAISHPPGMRTCKQGKNCGVPGMVAVVQSSKGSLANIEELMAQKTESAFVSADMLYWAYSGKQIFAAKGPSKDLRVLASLFQQSFHLMVNKWSDVQGPQDFKGKRISIGSKETDGYFQGMMLLHAAGLKPDEVNLSFDPPMQGAEKLKAGKADVLILVTGQPSSIARSLLNESHIRLLPLEGEFAQDMVKAYPFLQKTFFVKGTYQNADELHTLSIPMLWVTTKALPEKLAYQLLRELWHEKTRQQFEEGNPILSQITYGSSFEGVKTPLHRGAMTFHEELEILKQQRLFALDQPKTKGFDFSFKAIAGVLK